MHEILLGGVKHPLAPAAVLISSSSHPKTLSDINLFHQDPIYELISGARAAYFLKKLAHELGSRVSNSADVQNLASLINNSTRELERNWRMAACLTNAPVSTGYPFLPTMPTVGAAEASAVRSEQPNNAQEINPSLPSSSPPLPPSAVKASLNGSTVMMFPPEKRLQYLCSTKSTPFSETQVPQKIRIRNLDMAIPMQSTEISHGRPSFEFANMPAFRADQSVEYYSSSRNRWYETVVLKVHAEGSLDLKCRKNVDCRLVRAKENLSLPEKVKPLQVSLKRQTFEIGSKVEYYSDTMNGWVLSYVRGVNADGTYKLNSKKCADPSRIRSLLSEVPTRKASPNGPFVSTLYLKQVDARPEMTSYTRELCGLLGLPVEESVIVRMMGFTGGQNEGIWYMTIRGQKRIVCLKLVMSERKFASVPTERETYQDLLVKFPNIKSDSSLSFPFKVVQLVSPSSKQAVWDIIAMPVASGERLAEVIGRIYTNKRLLNEVFTCVGRRVREFHSRYNSQHGDLQSGNIFIDLGSMQVTLIDLGSMGRCQSCAENDDINYFKESIRLLAKTYGSEFESIATRAFSTSYFAC